MVKAIGSSQKGPDVNHFEAKAFGKPGEDWRSPGTTRIRGKNHNLNRNGPGGAVPLSIQAAAIPKSRRSGNLEDWRSPGTTRIRRENHNLSRNGPGGGLTSVRLGTSIILSSWNRARTCISGRAPEYGRGGNHSFYQKGPGEEHRSNTSTNATMAVSVAMRQGTIGCLLTRTREIGRVPSPRGP